MTTQKIATQVMDLTDTQLLVLHGVLEERELLQLRRELAGLVPEAVRMRAKVIVLPEGMELTALSDADLKSLGLKRL